MESGCGTWNRLLLGCNPGQFSFILRAASDTLPTAVNLQRWNIQCSAKCVLCGSTQPTTAHILGGCPIALAQGRYTYRHDQVLSHLTTELSKILSDQCIVYADLPGWRASDSPQATVPPSILSTSNRPDIVIHNKDSNAVALLELTCPLVTLSLQGTVSLGRRTTSYFCLN